jgi:hypothetical protein
MHGVDGRTDIRTNRNKRFPVQMKAKKRISDL